MSLPLIPCQLDIDGAGPLDPHAPLNCGLEAWWPAALGRGPRMPELRAQRHATLLGTARFTRSDAGPTLTLDSPGSVARVVGSVNGPLRNLLATRRYTAALWVRTSSTAIIRRLWGMACGAASFHSVILNWPSSGRVYFYCGHHDEAYSLYSNAADLNNGEWRHLAFVADGTQQHICVDGRLDASRMLPQFGAYAPPDDLHIGQNASYYPASQSFLGEISDVRVWDRPLSPAELRHVAMPSAFAEGLQLVSMRAMREPGPTRAIAAACEPALTVSAELLGGNPAATVEAHVDFEPANFAECPEGIVTTGSAVLAAQSATGMPDRPRSPRPHHALELTLTPGSGSATVSRTLSKPRRTLHARVLLQLGQPSQGNVTFMRGHAADDTAVFELAYHADIREITATLPFAGSPPLAMSVPVLPELPWNCVELALDLEGAQASMSVNGITRGTLSLPSSALAVSRVLLGVVEKSSNAAGVLRLDEWMLATGPCGPVWVEPVADTAADPARWLVVYNRSSSDSASFAAAYAQARDVPLANLVGLELPANEIISEAQALQMRQDLKTYLQTNRLTGIAGVLLGHGVPGVVDTASGLLPLSARLHDLLLNQPMPSNPWFADSVPQRPSVALLQGILLTARMDGSTLADSIAWLDRATALRSATADAGDNAQLVVQPDARGSGDFLATAKITSWLQSVDRMRTLLPLHVSASAQPTKLERDGYLWGWVEAEPPADCFVAEPGFRAMALPLSLDVATGPSLRSGDHWLRRLRAQGYASVLATTQVGSAQGIPLPRPFFEALRRGWSLAEAFHLACPSLSGAWYLAGDPLLTVAMPRTGWEIHGPLRSLEQLKPGQPALVVRDEVRCVTLPAELKPAQDQAAFYVLRRCDAMGRTEAGLTLVHFKRQALAASPVLMPPAWPSSEGWTPQVHNGQLRFVLLWERPAGLAGARAAELQARVSEAILTAGHFILRRSARFLEITTPVPTQRTQYRWRLMGDDAEVCTPWSASLSSPAGAAGTLKGWED